MSCGIDNIPLNILGYSPHSYFCSRVMFIVPTKGCVKSSGIVYNHVFLFELN